MNLFKIIVPLFLTMTSFAKAGTIKAEASEKAERNLADIQAVVRTEYSKSNNAGAKIVEVLCGESVNVNCAYLVIDSEGSQAIFSIGMFEDIRRLSFSAMNEITVNYTIDEIQDDLGQKQVRKNQSLVFHFSKNPDGTIKDTIETN